MGTLPASILIKAAPVFDLRCLRWFFFFFFVPFSTHVRTNFLFCVFSIFSSALSHSRIWEGIGLRLLGGLHWQRHSGDGRLFHGVMQFSGAVRRRGYGVLKPRRVKHQGFPGGWFLRKRSCFCIAARRKTRYDFCQVKGTLRALEMGCMCRKRRELAVTLGPCGRQT